MFCEKCGSKVNENDAFCTNCGSPVKKEEKVETTEEEKETEVTPIEQEDNSSKEVEKEVTKETVVSEKTTPVYEKEKVKKGSKAGVLVAVIAVVLIAVAGALLIIFKDKIFGNNSNSGKPLETIEKAVNNMVDMKSYTISVNLDAKAQDEEVSGNLDLSVDMKNKMASLNANVSLAGMSIELPAYADLSDKNNGVIYFKLPEVISGTSEWSKISLGEIDFDEILDSTDTKLEFTDEYKSLDIAKKVKCDEKNTDKYEFVINEENVKKIKEANKNFDLDFSELQEIGFKNGFTFYVYVNAKDNYITKFEFDLANSFETDEVKFDKFNMSIEFKDINKVKEIEIPSEAKKAKELDLSDVGSSLGFGDDDDDDFDYPLVDDDDDDNDNDYVDDYAITDYGYKVKYEMPKDFTASFVNSDDFKIYRRNSDELRVTLSNYWKTVEEAFDGVKSDKEYYESSDYKNVSLSEEKTIKVNGKEFSYVILSYEAYGVKHYDATVCYELDDEYIYMVEYEKTDSPLTDDELKLFLDITVTKK